MALNVQVGPIGGVSNGTVATIGVVVAVVTMSDNNPSAVVDWSAYMGGFTYRIGAESWTIARARGIREVAEGGDKIGKSYGTALFPALPAELYRE